jgi:hypothetical protein
MISAHFKERLDDFKGVFRESANRGKWVGMFKRVPLKGLAFWA